MKDFRNTEYNTSTGHKMQYFTNRRSYSSVETYSKRRLFINMFQGLTITLHVKQDRKQTYKPNIATGSLNHFRHGKAISITRFECAFLVLFIQHAMTMRIVIFLSLASLDLSHPRYLINVMIFEKKKGYWTNNVDFDFLYNLVWNIYHSKKKWERYYQKFILVFM
jgi:hypothetical protein